MITALTKNPSKSSKKSPIEGSDTLPFLLTKEQTACLLICCTRHVNNLTKRGLLPSIRLGRAIRYRTETVMRVIEKLEAQSPVNAEAQAGEAGLVKLG